MNSSSPPPPHVLAAFNLPETPQQLPGGQGQSYQVANAVLKPVDERQEAEYVSRLQHELRRNGDKTPGYQLAEPIPATGPGQPCEYVVDGWAATVLIPDCAGPNELEDRWARGDRIAWDEEQPAEDGVQIVPEFEEAFKGLLQLRRPIAAENTKCQLVHGDLAGNVLFPVSGGDSASSPTIIDLSLYWRPVEYAEAIVVADGLIWHGEGENLVRVLGTDAFRLQMLVRALIFRLVASSEALRQGHGLVDDDEPKAFVRAVRLVAQLLEHDLTT
ncbi:ribosomal protein L1 [Coccidioides immitis H538.4]|uniref:Ribosomal protein L1 n=2 Tax=Coccidioides immitis TaxID=5501 RepID=A0A0J8TV98_COCIT|nr:ribosomal protein L1 [Coccidioides immitis RMSCC 3703]KMU85711.1 ribosomal protein L1 [Coccidioides immitis H538.4]